MRGKKEGVGVGFGKVFWRKRDRSSVLEARGRDSGVGDRLFRNIECSRAGKDD